MATRGHSSCSSMSNHTKERVNMAMVTLENFYCNLIDQHEEREMRWVFCTMLTQTGTLKSKDDS